MEPYKRRPPGDYRPKADRFDPRPLRHHEEMEGGAYGREAEAKLFGREHVGSSPVRSLREDRRRGPEARARQDAHAIRKAERSGVPGNKCLQTGATECASATWRKQPLKPTLREGVDAVRPKKTPSACAPLLLAMLGAILMLAAIAGFVLDPR